MRKKIGECLVQAGLITEADLQTALVEHKRSGERLGSVLVRMNLARREEDPADRRLVRSRLTEEGEAACSRLEQSADAYTRRILVEIAPEDLEAMVRGLTAFMRASEAVRRDVPDLAAVAMP